jgi:2-polyprenyl-3-methyl-5-hydroxy-6-metoxy-1,4-benzoquinol methylase
MIATLERVELGFPGCLDPDFSAELPYAISAVDRVISRLTGMDCGPLERRSPGLRGCDWSAYLRCSIARMVHAGAAVTRAVRTGGRVLDYGSYFGNTSHMLREMGLQTDAADSYRAYDGAFARHLELMRESGVQIHDFGEIGFDLHAFQAETFDAVVCLGVIEHIPHTARPLLQSLTRVLRPDGVLVLDTPNHAYLYNRQKLARGESVMAPIGTQFYADGQFEGHHREYTPSELVWMLKAVGHVNVSVEMFNYSAYALGSLEGEDALNHWLMVLDPSMREIIMTTSRPGVCGAPGRDPEDWRELLVERESHWQSQIPDDVAAYRHDVDAQAEIAAARRHAHLVDEIERRDREIAALNSEIGALLRDRDRLLRYRLPRLWRRLRGV